MDRFQMRWFSWYLAKFMAVEVVWSFLTGTAIFLFIMLMFQAIRLSEFFVVHQVGGMDVLRISMYLMLSFLPIAVPIAFLFAVLMGISRANSEGEILAIQSSGISLGQLFSPLGAFSVFVTLFCLYTALWTVPKGNRAFELLITKLSSERVMSQLRPGIFQEGFFGLTVLAEQVIPLKNEMRKVFIYDERDEKHPLAITARQGILRQDPEKSLLTLRLSNGSIHIDKKEDRGILQKIDFDVYDINLELQAGGNAWRDYSPPSYSYNQLVKRLEETQGDPPAHRQLQVEMHRRFSLSFACIIFGALGFVIGVISQRGIRSTAVIFCLLVGTIYWVSWVGANALALGGWLVPWIAVWAPNFVFMGLTYWLYFKFAKR